MKNISTGTGLVALSAAILGSTVIMRYGPTDQAAHAAPLMEAVKAIAAASTAQVTPTIVWYGTCAVDISISGGSAQHSPGFWCLRAWSDGKLEAMFVSDGAQLCSFCGCPSPAQGACKSQWVVISDPAQGYTYRSDINFDSKVDGADLGTLLADWGNAPRQDIPPSDCPLNLINPR